VPRGVGRSDQCVLGTCGRILGIIKEEELRRWRSPSPLHFLLQCPIGCGHGVLYISRKRRNRDQEVVYLFPCPISCLHHCSGWGTPHSYEMCLPVFKWNSGPWIDLSWKLTQWWLNGFCWLGLGQWSKFQEISFWVHIYVLWGHCIMVGKETANNCLIEHWSWIHGDDSCWEGSCFSGASLQQCGYSHIGSDFSIGQQPIHNCPCRKSHFPHPIQTYWGLSSLGVWRKLRMVQLNWTMFLWPIKLWIYLQNCWILRNSKSSAMPWDWFWWSCVEGACWRMMHDSLRHFHFPFSISFLYSYMYETIQIM